MNNRLSICIVTSGIKGPIRFGGIATAFHNLSLFLAEAGHDVSVLYVNHPYYYSEDHDYWKSFYARQKVNLIPLKKDKDLYGTKEMQESYYVLQHLSSLPPFDVLIFHDLKGIAYYALLAKKLGKQFKDTYFILNAHASSKLSNYFNARPSEHRDELTKYFLEKSSLELADLVVSPSLFYLDWMENNKIVVDPSRRKVLQNILHPLPPATGRVHLPQQGRPLHFCFFSRLDTLKGIFVFTEAFEKLFRDDPQVHEKIQVSFIGDPVMIGGRSSLEVLKEITKTWPVRVDFQSDLTTMEALDYIRINKGVAISSTLGETSSYIVLECLSYGIPILASDLPNIRELISDTYHDSHLFRAGDPDALLDRLKLILDHGIDLPELKISPEKSRQNWLDLLDTIQSTQPSGEVALPDMETPLVSIIIPTYNKRSRELKEAVDSLINQTYTYKEIIIAHDGNFEISDKPALGKIGRALEEAGVPYKIEYVAKSYKPQVCNQAAAIAKGAYLCFFDDDDIARPHMIEEFVRVARLTGGDMITDFAQNFVTDPDQGESVPWCGEKVEFRNISLALGHALNVGFYQHFFGKANLFLSKKAFDAVGGMTVNEFKTPYIDWDLYVKVAMAGFRIELIPEDLYYYRMHSHESIYYTTHSRENFDAYINRYHGHLKVVASFSSRYPEIGDLLEFAHFQLSLPRVMSDPEISGQQHTNGLTSNKHGDYSAGLVHRIYFLLGLHRCAVLRKFLKIAGRLFNKMGKDLQHLSSLDQKE